MAYFPTLPCLVSPLWGTHQNFWMKLTMQKPDGWGYLPYGKNLIILTSTVFD